MDFKALSDPVVLVGDDNNKPGFLSRIRPPETGFLKNKKILGGTLTVFLLFAVGVGVYLAQKPTQLQPKADEVLTDPSQVNLLNSTASAILNPDIQSKGDGNQDGAVDLQDLSILLSNWNSTPESTSSMEIDFNSDGRINSIDNLQMDQLLRQQGITSENR